MNRELIEKTMQHIVDHPEQHHQELLGISDEPRDCGSPGCFVGWAMHFEGITARDLGQHYGGSAVQWASAAMGIPFDEVGQMFRSNNTIPMLQLMVKDVLNGDPVLTADHYRKELSS